MDERGWIAAFGVELDLARVVALGLLVLIQTFLDLGHRDGGRGPLDVAAIPRSHPAQEA
jgi:hypothetical protein